MNPVSPEASTMVAGRKQTLNFQTETHKMHSLEPTISRLHPQNVSFTSPFILSLLGYLYFFDR